MLQSLDYNHTGITGSAHWAGRRVCGGKEYDYDTGVICMPVSQTDVEHPMANGPNLFVRWDSGVSTWTPITILVVCV